MKHLTLEWIGKAEGDSTASREVRARMFPQTMMRSVSMLNKQLRNI